MKTSDNSELFGERKYEKEEFMEPLDGQEEIFECFKTGDHMRLWNLVKFVGYKEVTSPNMRKMCFINAFNDFDPTINNNFITFYSNRLHYLNVNCFHSKIKGITQDKRALKDYEEHKWWPNEKNSEPVNQNANILRNFSF